MNNTLDEKFLGELFAWCLCNRTVFDVVKRWLKFSYLPNEVTKTIWTNIREFHDKYGKTPTTSILRQNISSLKKKNKDVLMEFVNELSDYDVEKDDTPAVDNILNVFEEYLKKMMFLECNENIVEAYNSQQIEKAYLEISKLSQKLNEFTVKGSKYETVFGDFKERQMNRLLGDEKSFRFHVATGIDELDELMSGVGLESGEYMLIMADSGVGKSQALVHFGITAARLEKRVVHFQLEGTKEQCFNRYDSAWTGTLYRDVKKGIIETKDGYEIVNGNTTRDLLKDKTPAIEKIIERFSKKDIRISAEENFAGKTLEDLRKELKEIEKAEGKVDVIIVDYLELLELSDNKYSPDQERFRQGKLSKGMKSLAVEFNAIVIAATQSSNIPFDKRNDIEFVITRDNLSEDKGKLRPTDVFITLNQTIDERKENRMRIWADKLRDHNMRKNKPITIFNNYERSRFYDKPKTMEYLNAIEDGDIEEPTCKKTKKRKKLIE